MLSAEQEKERELKMLRVASLFLKGNLSDEEIARETGISSSSVGRYLTDTRLIPLLSKIGKDGLETFNYIQHRRRENLLEAKKKGGLNFAKNNVAEKDELGKFTGSRRK